ALINETRGLLHAYGLIVPQGAATFRTHVQEKVATEETKLTAHSRALFQQLLEELATLDARVALYDTQLAQVAQAPPVCQRLMTIPGLGELTATALVAAVSDTARYACDTLDLHVHPRRRSPPLCRPPPYWRCLQQRKPRCAPSSAAPG